MTIPVTGKDHSRGEPDAPAATLVEYGDYECPHCRQLHLVVKEVMGRTRGLQYVYRHFPLTHIHPQAARAAEAAEAAAAQGRFWEMHDLLFERNRGISEERLTQYAGEAGLETGRFASEMAAGVYAAKVQEDFNSAIFKGHVSGTPTLYLNGESLDDAHDLPGLLAAVMRAGATLDLDSHWMAGWPAPLVGILIGRSRL
ncbi:MAG TPA: thioredoxin domain-containing protein [Pyrinomonadaceae bacterium]|nr:thioredoxin domain-containing protein [Pyrinomonadaceae bacterium]